MTRVRKLLLVVLSVVLLSQIPFAYRRYKLRRLNAAIQSLNSARTATNDDGKYVEYRGVIHVHSFLGGHSSGTFQEIIAAAQTNQLQFVVMTEHAETQIDTSAMTLQGIHGGVLFVNGNEAKTANGDRLLVIPGYSTLSDSEKLSTGEAAVQAHDKGAISIVAYPIEFKDWGSTYDGLEVYNVFTNARRINPVVAFFDTLWSHRSYPDLMFANYYERPTVALEKWDELLMNRKLVALAGNDAHSNIGISLKDSSDNELIGLKLDPYKTSFHLVRVHALIVPDKQFDAGNLLEALRVGHCFIGFDFLGDTTGFRFEATSPSGSAIQGDEISLQNETRLTVTLPVPGRLLLFKNGKVILDETGLTKKDLDVTDRGVYRAEVYLPQLGHQVSQQPWIISNPIYVR